MSVRNAVDPGCNDIGLYQTSYTEPTVHPSVRKTLVYNDVKLSVPLITIQTSSVLLYLYHSFGASDLLHLSPTPHFKTFQSFLSNF
jgi:hypothetical protein